MENDIRVLCVDDDPTFLRLTKIYLQQKNKRLNIIPIESAGRALELLEREDLDLIVSDYQMPGMDGLEFLKVLRQEKQKNVPFIIFTGKGREEVAIKALNLGADRYLQKGGDPSSQYGVLSQAIEQLVSHHRKAEALKESETEKRLILENTNEVFIFQNVNHEIIWTNKAGRDSLGMKPEEIKGRKCYELWQKRDAPCEGCPVEEALNMGKPQRKEFPTPDGKTWLVSANLVKDNQGEIAGIVETALDITKRKEAEKLAEEMHSLRRAIRDINQLIVTENSLSELFPKVCNTLSNIRLYLDISIAIQRKDGTIAPYTQCGKHRRKPWEIKSVENDDAPVCIKEVLRSGRAKIIKNTRTHGECMRCEYCEHDANHHSILTPMVKDGIVNGILFVCLPAKKQVTQEEIDLLEEVSGDLAFARDKIIAEEKLRESEARYRILFNQSVEGIYVHDLNGNILDVNQMACTQSGYSKEELLKMSIFDLHPESSENEDIITQWHGWSPGERYTIESEHISKEGEAYPVEISTGVTINKNKRLILALTHDITKRKEAERVLKESEEQYRLLFLDAPVSIIIHDKETGIIIDANPAAYQMYGFDSLSEMMNNELWYNPPYSFEDALNWIQKTAQEGPQQFEWLGIRVDGSLLWEEVHLNLITINGKERVMATAIDITERKKQKNAQINQN